MSYAVKRNALPALKTGDVFMNNILRVTLLLQNPSKMQTQTMNK